MTAPERIWADLNGTWYDEATSFRGVPYPGYILATHEAIASSPEVAAMIAEARREARREERERCAQECDRIAGNTEDFNHYTRRAAGMCAANIRALKEETP